MQVIHVTETEEGQRLDRFLKKYLRTAPLGFIYKAIRRNVKVNGARVGVESILKAGDEISLYLGDSQIAEFLVKEGAQTHKRQFKIVFEDDNLLVVTKPFGLLTHGDKQEKKNTLANQVVGYLIDSGSYLPGEEKTFTPASVNRLDRNTTGLVLFGKNPKALRDLNAMLRHHEDMEKTYLTIVKGQLTGALHLKGKIVKDELRNLVTILPETAEEGRTVETKAIPVQQLNGYTLTEVTLITGRPHQIRAHMAHAGFPIVGDAKYGDKRTNRYFEQRFGLTTQLLHAYKVRVNEGRESLTYLKGVVFESEYPENIRTISSTLSREESRARK
ncbi:MAG: RluA family pseudouridine synthase [Clostridiales Family XIII bacterium]|jgi:23S rRNA pseudouridine955/2504/2580 synthase|nr:RluA family pseudouridine synthase [Clostridiales Family XIII bacterium]